MFTPTPDQGSYLASVTGDPGCSATMVLLDVSKRCTFQFALLPSTLSVTKRGSGAGTVTSSPAGINCGGTCSAMYPPETMVTLTATASAGSTFVRWSGSCTGTAPTATVTLGASATCTAELELLRTLTVTKTGTGLGTVTSSPAGIDCGPSCTDDFADGTTVHLTAHADSSSTFAGWSGDCSSTGAVTRSDARTCTAEFDAAVSGCGTITVTPKPGGEILFTASKSGVEYIWTRSWISATVDTGSSNSFDTDAPQPGTYTISVFVVGPECSASTMFTL
jgi:hypothetical protein